MTSTETQRAPSGRTRMAEKSFNRVLMQVVGPVLIILMIGALVFFLIEVFYRGPHSARLGWVFGLFTGAAVLVSRISVEEGMERAALFGFGLAAATLIVTLQLVDFEYGALSIVLKPIVVSLFIAVVMWSANRLTWDCTVIDESRDVSSIGIIELIKRKIRNRKKKKPANSTLAKQGDAASKNDGVETDDTDFEMSSVGKFLFLFFASSKTKNTPGLWIFYFAMAAFPIFGFGQWFAQANDSWGYRWIFFLFAVYLGAALGLLMLTSLLGLERYLHKRGAQMPGSVSRTWMTVGTLFALGIMLIMLALPSPSLSLGFENALGFLTTDNKNTSQHAVGNDGQEEGDNAKGEKAGKQDGAKQKPGDNGEASGKGKNGKKQSNAKGDSSGKKGDKSKGNQSKEDKSKGDKSKGDKSKGDKSDGKKSEDSQSKGDKKSEKDQQDQNDKNRDRDDQQKKKQDNANQNNAKQAKQNQGNRNRRNRNRNQNRQQQNQSQSSQPSQLLQSFGKFMRYVIYGVGLIVLGVVLWMFRDELAKFWEELFGKKEKKSEGEAKPIEKSKPKKPLPPFSRFQDPFSNGAAANSPPAKTIQYTFSAFEAWARDHGLARESDQTPHEFARKLPGLFAKDQNSRLDSAVVKEISSEAKKLADIHGKSLYSGVAVDVNVVPNLKRIWRLMFAHAPLPQNTQQVLVNS